MSKQPTRLFWEFGDCPDSWYTKMLADFHLPIQLREFLLFHEIDTSDFLFLDLLRLLSDVDLEKA